MGSQRIGQDLATEHMCEERNISCHISKQTMSYSPSTVATADGELVNLEGTQKGKNACHLTATRLQPLPTLNSENSGCQNTGSWPQIAQQRNDFSEPRISHPFIKRKA